MSGPIVRSRRAKRAINRGRAGGMHERSHTAAITRGDVVSGRVWHERDEAVLGMAGKSEDKPPKDEGMGLRMLKTRTVLVTGPVDDKLAERTIEKLLILEAENHDPIRVLITSQGGHVDSGMAIHDMLRFIESPVVTIGVGWVASIAVPILFGATRERRYSLPHTRFLLHQPSGGAGGQATDIRLGDQCRDFWLTTHGCAGKNMSTDLNIGGKGECVEYAGCATNTRYCLYSAQTGHQRPSYFPQVAMDYFRSF